MAQPAEVQDDLANYLRLYPAGNNQAELAFLLLRTPKMHSLDVSAAPATRAYCSVSIPDLDYVNRTLRMMPAEKFRLLLQGECLRRYWPKLAAFQRLARHTRHCMPSPPQRAKERQLAVVRGLHREFREAGRLGFLRESLTMTARMRLAVSAHSGSLGLRSSWWTQPLMELHLRRLRVFFSRLSRRQTATVSGS